LKELHLSFTLYIDETGVCFHGPTIYRPNLRKLFADDSLKRIPLSIQAIESLIVLKMRQFLSFAAFAAAIEAQELYLTTTGNAARSQCTQSSTAPNYHFQPFSYTLNETVR
jgi:hypothetical protein